MPDWQGIVALVSAGSPQAVITAVAVWALIALIRRHVIGEARDPDKPAAERLAEVTNGGPKPGLAELLARLLRVDEKLDRLDSRIERVERRFESLPCGLDAAAAGARNARVKGDRVGC